MTCLSRECFAKWIFQKAHIIWRILTNMYIMFGCRADAVLIWQVQMQIYSLVYLHTVLLYLVGWLFASVLGVAGASAASEKKGLAQLARMSSFMGLSEPAHEAHLTHQTHQCSYGTGLRWRGTHTQTHARLSPSVWSLCASRWKSNRAERSYRWHMSVTVISSH